MIVNLTVLVFLSPVSTPLAELIVDAANAGSNDQNLWMVFGGVT
jgi:hypothetical protein